MVAKSASVTSMELIGEFPLVRTLGHVPGGATSIVRGDDGPWVAEVLDRASSPPAEVAQFLKRARAVAAINHRGIGAVRAIVDNKAVVALVTDLEDAEWLAELGGLAAFSFVARLRILVDLLDALNTLHSAPSTLPVMAAHAHVIHGEIVPANILVGLDGVTRLARTVRASPARTHEETAACARYSAPEQLLGDSTADGRVDIYAVGALLWEALAGHPLFAGDDASTILARQVAGRIPLAPLPDGAAWADPLIDVARRALALKPSDRFASVAELATAMRRGVKLAPVAEVAAKVNELAGPRVLARRRALLEQGAQPQSDRAPAKSPRPTSGFRSGRSAPRQPIANDARKTAPGEDAMSFPDVTEVSIDLGVDVDLTLVDLPGPVDNEDTAPIVARPIPLAPSTSPDVLAHLPPPPVSSTLVDRPPTAAGAASPSRVTPPTPATKASKVPSPARSVVPPTAPRASQAPKLPARASQAPPLPARASQAPKLPARASQAPPLPSRASQAPKLPARASQAPHVSAAPPAIVPPVVVAPAPAPVPSPSVRPPVEGIPAPPAYLVALLESGERLEPSKAVAPAPIVPTMQAEPNAAAPAAPVEIPPFAPTSLVANEESSEAADGASGFDLKLAFRRTTLRHRVFAVLGAAGLLILVAMVRVVTRSSEDAPSKRSDDRSATSAAPSSKPTQTETLPTPPPPPPLATQVPAPEPIVVVPPPPEAIATDAPPSTPRAPVAVVSEPAAPIVRAPAPKAPSPRPPLAATPPPMPAAPRPPAAPKVTKKAPPRSNYNPTGI